MPDIAEMTRAIVQLTEVRSLISSCMLREMRERLEATQEDSIKKDDTLGLFNTDFVRDTRHSIKIAIKVLEKRLAIHIEKEQRG